jgi:serine/threonine protein kinase/tetratricopeptide (TPR) repeat protein
VRFRTKRYNPQIPETVPEKFELANQLFSDALALSASERDAYVKEACGSDTGLRDSVLKLLSRFDGLGDFLERPAAVALAPPRSEFLPESVLADRFRVVDLLGRGGMGDVYRAEDLTLGETVALKTIRTEWRSDAAMLARFRDEIKLARRISHPNICRIFDLFTSRAEDGSQVAFFTMEYLDGEPLSETMRRRGRIEWREALGIAEGIAAGLDAAHQQGIVHRDLKPGNVILTGLTGGSRPVITDFGLAKLAEQTGGPGTQTGTIAGSPDYMAPEQFLGETVTRAADVFAFGLIVYEMVAGTRPYPSESLLRAAVRRISSAPRPFRDAAPEAPKHWDRALRRALSRDPGQRQSTAGALVRELQAPPGFSAVALSRITVARPSRRSLVMGGAAAISVAGLGVFWRLYDWEALTAPLMMLTPITSAANPDNARPLDILLEKGLRQSEHVKLLSQDKIAAAWKLMARPGPVPAKLDPVDAREIALRQKADLVLFGDLGWANGEWVLKIGVERMGDSPTRARSEKTDHFYASDQRGLIAAAGQAVDWVRRTAGESQSDIGAHDRAPEEVTTSSWEALKEYTAGMDAWNLRPVDQEWPPDQREAAEGHLLRALEIDPHFAQAAAKLADLQLASNEFDKGMLNYARAARLIGERNLTDRESLMIRGMFALDTGQYAKAEQVFSRLALEYPKDGLPLFHEARAVECQGHMEASLRLLDMAARKDPNNYAFVLSRGIRYLTLGHLAEAQQDCDRAARMNASDWTDQTRSALAFARRDMPGVWAALEHMKAAGSVAYRSKAFALEACLRAEQGRLPEAQNLLEEGLRFDLANGLPPQVQIDKRLLVSQAMLLQRRPESAIEVCRGILETKPGIWPTLDTGALLARAGDIRGAQACLPRGLPKQPPAEAPQSLPEGTAKELFEWPIYWRRILRLWAEIALATGRPQTAFVLLQAAPPPEIGEEWPDALVRASVASGERNTAEKLLAALFRNPAAYWIAANVAPIDFMRQAIAQAKVVGTPAESWTPLERFLSQSK